MRIEKQAKRIKQMMSDINNPQDSKVFSFYQGYRNALEWVLDDDDIGNNFSEKFERYALNHYLSEWPDKLSFHEVIEWLSDCALSHAIDVHEHYQDWPSRTVAGFIEDMASELIGLFYKQKD